MHRCFITISDIKGSEILLRDPREMHHILHVLRLKIGEHLVCCDEKGMEYSVGIASVGRGFISLKIDKKMMRNLPGKNIHLAPAVLKSDKLELVIQKATELGASSITPIITDHVVAKFSKESIQKKLPRWQKISLEASKQCKRNSPPKVNPTINFDDFLASYKDKGLLLMPTLCEDAMPLKNIFRGNASDLNEVIVLVGPEGDFSPREICLAKSCGASLVSLGKLTLRSETASIYILAVLQYIMDTP